MSSLPHHFRWMAADYPGERGRPTEKKVTWSKELRQVRSISPRARRSLDHPYPGPPAPRQGLRPEHAQTGRQKTGGRAEQEERRYKAGSSSASMVCLKLLSQSTKTLMVQAQGMPRAL